MKTLAAFTGAYVLSNLLLAAVSYALSKFFMISFDFHGLVAAGVGAVVAGHIFSRYNTKFSTDLSKAGYTFGMGGIIAVLALLQAVGERYFYSVNITPTDQLPKDLLLPLIAMAYLAVLRLCFSVGANAGFRVKHGLADLKPTDSKSTSS